MTLSAVEEKKAITREAAAHVARAYAGDMTETEEQALFDWLAQSADHQAEYRKLLEVWGRLGVLSDKSAVIHAVTGHGRRRPMAKALLGLAASIFLALSVWWYWGAWGPVTPVVEPYIVHSTAVGEQKAIRLPDGSLVHLNTDSMVRVRDTQTARQVILDKGEAFFQVLKSQRPFTVKAGNQVVTVLGTRFNLFKKVDRLTLAVVEGTVALHPETSPVRTMAEPGTQAGQLPMVQVGDQYRLSAGSVVTVDNNARLLATVTLQTSQGYRPWHRGQVAFNNTPLQEVVAEVSRYTTKTIAIADPGIRALPISGVLHLSDVEQALAALEVVFPLKIDFSDDRITLNKR